MSTWAGDTSSSGTPGMRTCAACGTQYADWSMFCTKCGVQAPETQPAKYQQGVTAPVYRQGPAVMTTSNSDSTVSIVLSILGVVLCFLFLFGGFSRAKKARLHGEPNAQAATTVAWVCLCVWGVIALLNLVVFALSAGSSSTP
jgi:hypothetical protein